MNGPGVAKPSRGRLNGRAKLLPEPEPVREPPRSASGRELPPRWSQWPSVQAVAARLGLQSNQVRVLVATGRLAPPEVCPDGTSRYDPELVEAYLQTQREEQVRTAELVSASEMMRLCLETSAQARADAQGMYKLFHDPVLQVVKDLMKHNAELSAEAARLRAEIDKGYAAQRELHSDVWARDMATREFDHRIETRKTALGWVAKAVAAKFGVTFDQLKTQAKRAAQGETPDFSKPEMTPAPESALPAWKRLIASFTPEQQEQLLTLMTPAQLDIFLEVGREVQDEGTPKPEESEQT